MEALANVFEDKVEFCRRYGFQITHDDWPSSGCVPARVGTDRGPENLGTNSDSIPGLDIALLTLPKWRPDLKGQLENRFQLLRTGLDLELPGRRRSRRRRPGDPDPERTAAITPREYFIELLRWVIDYNTTHVFAVDRRTPLMKQARTAPHPAAFFRDAVRFHTGTLRREDPVIVRRHLLVRGRARITREGIRYKGLYYTSDRAVRENWSQRRAVPGWKGDVRVDRRNTEVIYLDLGRAGLEAVKFSDKNDQQFKSFDFDEVEQDQQAFQEQRGEALGRQSDRAIVRRTELRRITAGATRRRDEATKNQPHRARTNDKGVHRGATSADIDREQAEHFAKGVATGSRPTLTPPPASQNHRRAAPPPPAARPARGADIRLFEEAARRKQEREAQLRSSQQHQGANDDTSR